MNSPIWLAFITLGSFILYLIIKTAINHSEISNTEKEVKALQTQLNRQHQEMLEQVELLRKTITEERNWSKGNKID
ncbi:hypothetical protein [Paenibacillus sp. L3-i20]|uniref:hypothetical protein n=1 Tax=Paenibacillus sp. L3-i20 TaxID=2905833 RepID=UPI001EDFFBAE|nr:hypothetical protein [Paenibacillus sp. L3-i20]GKU79195.1 hypothetical protein L3i20_v235920 [Paenibacillus sp. L3-i20]